MNEELQHLTLDKLMENCPMFNNQEYEKIHNREFWRTHKHYNTLCEIDSIYNFKDYVVVFEEKTRDSHACHKKMEKQMTRFKKYQRKILKDLDLDPNKRVYYFYAHFENDLPHIDYRGTLQKIKRGYTR